jgi:hypothetical protein
MSQDYQLLPRFGFSWSYWPRCWLIGVTIGRSEYTWNDTVITVHVPCFRFAFRFWPEEAK